MAGMTGTVLRLAACWTFRGLNSGGGGGGRDFPSPSTPALRPAQLLIKLYNIDIMYSSGFGGLGVACWPLVPKFAGSNPAEAVGFLGAKKSSARLPSEGK